MPYVDPLHVVSPKEHVGRVQVVYDGGSGSWAVALVEYDGEPRVGIRWNGADDSPIGNPQSRGKPTWFIVPRELEGLVREQAEQLSHSQEGGLLAGYREMANDREREEAALAWSESLIDDAAPETR